MPVTLAIFFLVCALVAPLLEEYRLWTSLLSFYVAWFGFTVASLGLSVAQALVTPTWRWLSILVAAASLLYLAHVVRDVQRNHQHMRLRRRGMRRPFLED